MSAVKGKEKIFPESRVDSGWGVGWGSQAEGKREGAGPAVGVTAFV